MVNIKDTYEEIEIPENVWMDLLTKQGELHDKYRLIEIEIGYGVTGNIPFHLDSRHWQYYIKDLMWRVTEEVAEAYQALSLGETEHYHEECIDALHFLLEINVVVGRPYAPDAWFGSAHLGQVVFELGLAANCLKNKPWKQDFKETDINAFFGYLDMASRTYWAFLCQLFGNEGNIYRMYMAKHDVNEFRIRSKY